MKRLASIVFVLLVGPALAYAGKGFPIGGLVRLNYRTPHSTFVPTEGDANFGASTMRLSVAGFYSPKLVKGLTLAGSFGFSRAMHETFNRAFGSAQVQPKQIRVSDLSLSANWNFPKLGPVIVTAGLGGTVGISNMSRATGTLGSVSPSLSATWPTPIGLIVSLNGSVDINLNKDPTAQVDDGATLNQLVSGTDTGQSNLAGVTGVSSSLSYQVIPGLFVNGTYFMQEFHSAVEGADDAFTSSFAQTGRQSSDPMHGTAFSMRYQMKQMGGGAAAAFNTAVKNKAKQDLDPWTDHVAISFGMVTMNRLFSPDNKHLTNPLFDTASNLHARTLYSLTLTGMM